MKKITAPRPTSDAQDYLTALAEELTIPPSRYKQANESYFSLGNWLNREQSTLNRYKPHVYSQGSFRLGTAIRPITDAEDYDVDAVCELNALTKKDITQSKLKELVGFEIQAYHDSQNMKKPVREGRRCWVLDYADGAQFHMDIVPAIPNANDARLLFESKGVDARWTGTAIVITDNEHSDYFFQSDNWPRSNPTGYYTWFRSRMGRTFDERRRILAEQFKKSVDAIPEYEVVTPLQQAVMVLKRHRDVTFKDNESDKPISVIITTLAAHSYEGEPDAVNALLAILARMDEQISFIDGHYVISNPTDPLENFADKWAKHPRRAENFFHWLELARDDFFNAAGLGNQQKIVEKVAPRIGQGVAERAKSRTPSRRPDAGASLLRRATTAPVVAHSFPARPRSPSEPDGFGTQ